MPAPILQSARFDEFVGASLYIAGAAASHGHTQVLEWLRDGRLIMEPATRNPHTRARRITALPFSAPPLQLDSFDTADIQALAAAVGGLTPTALASLSDAQLAALTPAQVGALTATQIDIAIVA